MKKIIEKVCSTFSLHTTLKMFGNNKMCVNGVRTSCTLVVTAAPSSYKCQY